MGPAGRGPVLVTGRTGFTGAHLSRSLTKAGWQVLGLGDDPSTGDASEPPVSLSDAGRNVEWLRALRPTHVVHLAALSHVVGDALAFYDTNVLGTESLLAAIAQAGLQPQRVVIASSANVYGNSLSSPIGEEHPIQPMNHYAVSKAAMELLVSKWRDRLPITVTRPFNYTGVGQSHSFVFPKIVRAFAMREPTLRLGNLDVRREISDVADVCEAYRRLLSAQAPPPVVNICSGTSIGLNEMLDLMERISGWRPEIIVDQQLVRPDEVKELRGDPALLHRAVGTIERRTAEDTLTAMYRYELNAIEETE